MQLVNDKLVDRLKVVFNYGADLLIHGCFALFSNLLLLSVVGLDCVHAREPAKGCQGANSGRCGVCVSFLCRCVGNRAHQGNTCFVLDKSTCLIGYVPVKCPPL